MVKAGVKNLLLIRGRNPAASHSAQDYTFRDNSVDTRQLFELFPARLSTLRLLIFSVFALSKKCARMSCRRNHCAANDRGRTVFVLHQGHGVPLAINDSARR